MRTICNDGRRIRTAPLSTKTTDKNQGPKRPKQARYSVEPITGEDFLLHLFTNPSLVPCPLLSRSEKTRFDDRGEAGGRRRPGKRYSRSLLCCRRRCSLPPPHPRISCYHKTVHKPRAMRQQRSPSSSLRHPMGCNATRHLGPGQTLLSSACSSSSSLLLHHMLLSPTLCP
jgi:hypothetical protein